MTTGDWKPTVEVEISPDGDGWFAECKLFDYAGCGMTKNECKENFLDGLRMTAFAHKQLARPHKCMICATLGKYNIFPNIRWKEVP